MEGFYTLDTSAARANIFTTKDKWDLKMCQVICKIMPTVKFWERLSASLNHFAVVVWLECLGLYTTNLKKD